MDFDELIGYGVPIHENTVKSNCPGVTYLSKKSLVGAVIDVHLDADLGQHVLDQLRLLASARERRPESRT